jgi:glyoxylase-like metal-dependent hydrolase (beta-lactamase superfamily II)
MSTTMEELRPGIHRWTARHPDWHPADAFGAEVASYALSGDETGTLLLVDPLLPDDAPDLLDDLARDARSVAIFITIGYHVRSTAALAERYGATAYGPEPARRRLPAIRPLDGPLPAGVTAHAIGRPGRSERPLHFPSHEAIAFGDAVVTTPDGALRMWCQDPVTAQRTRFYAERFAPTLQPLIDLGPLHILTTHGCPQMDEGGDALATCAAKPPWFHHS